LTVHYCTVVLRYLNLTSVSEPKHGDELSKSNRIKMNSIRLAIPKLNVMTLNWSNQSFVPKQKKIPDVFIKRRRFVLTLLKKLRKNIRKNVTLGLSQRRKMAPTSSSTRSSTQDTEKSHSQPHRCLASTGREKNCRLQLKFGRIY
jgi:hypothetical protein